jgi:hypothetical protein
MTAQMKLFLGSFLLALLFAVGVAAPALADGSTVRQDQTLTSNPPKPGNTPPNTDGPTDPPKPPPGYAAFELFFIYAFAHPMSGGTLVHEQNNGPPPPLSPEQINTTLQELENTPVGDVVPIVGDSGPVDDQVM